MNKLKTFHSYEEAKDIIQKHNLKSNKEWREFMIKHRAELNLHSAPDVFYKNSGWVSWYDFLGKTKSKNKKRAGK